MSLIDLPILSSKMIFLLSTSRRKLPLSSFYLQKETDLEHQVTFIPESNQ